MSVGNYELISLMLRKGILFKNLWSLLLLYSNKLLIIKKRLAISKMHSRRLCDFFRRDIYQFQNSKRKLLSIKVIPANSNALANALAIL